MRFFLLHTIAFLCTGCQYLFPPVEEVSPIKVEKKVFIDTPKVSQQNLYIDTDLSLSIEEYRIALPIDFDPKKTYGLVLFISPTDDGTPPYPWGKVLAERDLLVISPMKAGNDQEFPRRFGLGLLGVLAMQKEYKIDSKRIYASGLSGGARAASNLAMLRPDIFSGTIQSVGSVFVHDVPQVKTKSEHLRVGKGELYASALGAKDMNVDKIKKNVCFVIVTGPGDYRYGNLQDIYNGGFVRDGYQAKLIDVPGMGHRLCTAEDLAQALDFIESK